MKCFSWLMLLSGSIFFETFSAGTRNLIMPIDWRKETVAHDYDHPDYIFASEYGVTTRTLIAALYEQAAPILVSSYTWRNAIERAQIYRDIIQRKDISYLQRHKMFQNQNNLTKFVAQMQQGYNSQYDVVFVTKEKIDDQEYIKNNPALDFYYLYQTFYAKDPAFKPENWIIKKMSDYLYLFIPKQYVNKLQAKQDTPAIGRPLSTPLTPTERLLGMKIEKFPDIPAAVLLNAQAHAPQLNVSAYQKLVPKSAYTSIQQLMKQNWIQILMPYVFSQHVLYVLQNLLITRADLKSPNGNKEETDMNETVFLHEWLVYLDGHGSLSQDAKNSSIQQIKPIFYTEQQGTTTWLLTSGSATTAGLEQHTFRDVLDFFNISVRTGSFFYTSCYTGGPHLFTLFEHEYDFPKTSKRQKGRIDFYNQIMPDAFNYLIIAANQLYTVTWSSILGFSYSPQSIPGLQGGMHWIYDRWPNLAISFTNYFNDMAKIVQPQKPKISLKQELITAIGHVHQFDFSKNYMVPAIRLPYTEWFVSLADLGAQIRFESDQDRRAREAQQRNVQLQIEARKKVLPIVRKYKEIKETRPQELDAWIAKLPDQERKIIKTIYASESVVPEPFLTKKQFQEQQKLIKAGKDLFARMEKMADTQEKARLEKERLEKEEKDRKENQARIDALRKKQEAEARAQNQKPSQSKPPAGKPTPSSPLKPLPNQSNIQLPPPSPIPMGSKPLTPGTLPPPSGTVGQKPAKPAVPLQQALTQLKSSLFYVVDALLK